jgi:hypothetical protein
LTSFARTMATSDRRAHIVATFADISRCLSSG